MFKKIRICLLSFIVLCSIGTPLQVHANTDDAILHLDFDRNVLDTSGHGNDGVITGNPTYAKGIKGQAIHIQNSNGSTNTKAQQFISFHQNDLKFTDQNFSLSFWYCSDNGVANGGAMIANKNYSSGGNPGFAIGDFNDGLRFNFTADFGSRTDIRPLSPIDGVWHHLVINVDRSKSYIAYLDGQLVKEVAIKNDETKSIDVDGSSFVIGADGFGYNGLNDAYIDELYVFKHTLTTPEIIELYTDNYLPYYIELYENNYMEIAGNSLYDQTLLKNFANTIKEAKALLETNNLALLKAAVQNMTTAYHTLLQSNQNVNAGQVLYTSFDHEDAQDESGYENHGVITGTPNFEDGIIGKAIHIQNSNGSKPEVAKQYVSFPSDTLNFTNQNFAISFWYRSDNGVADGGALIANKNYNSGGNTGFAIGDFNDGLRFNFTPNNGKRTDIRPLSPIDGKWHHITINVDRQDSYSAYVDGDKVKAVKISDDETKTIDVNGASFVIGADGFGKNGLNDAYIDELRVFNRLLSTDEIDTFYLPGKLHLKINEYLQIIEDAKTAGVIPMDKITAFETTVQAVIIESSDANINTMRLLLKKLTNSYDRFLRNDDPIMSFQVMSDVHVQDNNEIPGQFIDALKDIKDLDPTSSAIVVNGDFADSGNEKQYKTFFDIMANYNPTPNTIVSIGNHEARWQPGGWEEARTRYLKYNQQYMGDNNGEMFFDKWIDGYHFIVINTEDALKDNAYLSDKQLAWLDQTMAENADPNKPIFLFFHQCLKDTYEMSDMDVGGEQDAQLKAILAKYPQNVMFTGHIHSGPDAAPIANIGYGTQVDLPSFSYNVRGIRRGQIGYQVNVYNDTVEIKARDYKEDEWLSEYDTTIDFKSAAFDDASRDIKDMEVSASSENNQQNANNLIDDDIHSIWASTNSNNQSLTFHLKEETVVDGIRLLPRQDQNQAGIITDYEVLISSDHGESWQFAAKGTYHISDLWTRVNFKPMKATDVKINIIKTKGTTATAAEVRIVEALSINFDLLQAKIEEAHSYIMTTGIYTKESLAQLQQTLNNAEEIVDHKGSTQNEVDQAVININTAITNLVKIPLNVDALSKLYQDNLYRTKTRYRADTWTNFTNSLQQAKEMLDHPTSQKDIDATYKALDEAIHALVTSLPLLDGNMIIEGNFAEDEQATVKVLNHENYQKNIPSDQYQLVALYDLTITKNGSIIPLDQVVHIKIKYDEHAPSTILYIDETLHYTELENQIKDGYITFQTNHFSMYGIAKVFDKNTTPTPEITNNEKANVVTSDTTKSGTLLFWLILSLFLLIINGKIMIRLKMKRIV